MLHCDRKGVKIRHYSEKYSVSTLYILNSWTIEDLHLIATSIAHTCVNFSRLEKFDGGIKSLGKWPGCLRNVATCPALLRALRTKSILFSQRLRARRWHLRLTCGWRNVTVDVPIASRHQRRLRRIDERGNNRVRSQYTMDATMTREGNVRVRVRVLVRVSPERKPYRTGGNYIRAVKLSRCMHVHATRPAHTQARARTRREIRENVDNGPDYKIWNDFVGACR